MPLYCFKLLELANQLIKIDESHTSFIVLPIQMLKLQGKKYVCIVKLQIFFSATLHFETVYRGAAYRRYLELNQVILTPHIRTSCKNNLDIYNSLLVEEFLKRLVHFMSLCMQRKLNFPYLRFQKGSHWMNLFLYIFYLKICR